MGVQKHEIANFKPKSVIKAFKMHRVLLKPVCYLIESKTSV